MKKTRVSRSTPCRKTPIRAHGKTFTLALPYSIGRTFTIGPITFEHNGSTWVPDRPIPESWTIVL